MESKKVTKEEMERKKRNRQVDSERKPLGEKPQKNFLGSNFICGRSAMNVIVFFYIFLCYLCKRTVARQKFQAKRFFRHIYCTLGPIIITHKFERLSIKGSGNLAKLFICYNF
jgi:hypothetical protein